MILTMELRPLNITFNQPVQRAGNINVPINSPTPILRSPDQFTNRNNFSTGIPAIGLRPLTSMMNPTSLQSGGLKFRITSYVMSERIKTMTPAELKNLGQYNKMEFFKALMPAAKEAEYKYGVPASVTLAQAALESGWAESPIGGYNIFGIKGKGPAGTKSVKTREWNGSRYITINDNFALYRNFQEAVVEHGKLFHNGYYEKGVNEYAINRNPYRFVDNVAKTYATSPTYAKNIKQIMLDYNLVALTA